MSQTIPASRAGQRRWSIRAKVRLALLSILCLIVPLVMLSIYYLVDLHELSGGIRDRAQLVMELQLLRDGVRRLEIPEDPVTTTEKTEAHFRVALNLLDERAAELSRRAPDFVTPEAGIIGTLGGLRKATDAWFREVRRVRNVAPNRKALEALVAQDPSATDVDFKVLSRAVADGHTALDLQVQGAGNRVAEDLMLQRKEVGGVVDHADRNLISLLLLIVILIGLLFIVLPERLMQPIRHITHVIRQAESGKLDVRIEGRGDDEVGLLAHTYNQAMARLREFDDRKRDRIVEDAAKLDAILAHFPYPAAILTRGLVTDQANRPFREAFGLGSRDDGSPLPDVLSVGREELRALLQSSVKQREGMSSRQVELTTAAGAPVAGWMTVDPCRDRRGVVTHLIVTLRASSTTAV